MGQRHFQVHSLNIRKPLLMTQTPLSTISATTYLAHTDQSPSQPIRKTAERGKGTFLIFGKNTEKGRELT